MKESEHVLKESFLVDINGVGTLWCAQIIKRVYLELEKIATDKGTTVHDMLSAALTDELNKTARMAFCPPEK